MLRTMSDIRAANAAAGFFFFEPATLRFFNSVIGRTVHPVPNGALFVTSEQFVDSRGNAADRLYTIRFAHDSGKVETVGEFQDWPSSENANRVCRQRLAPHWTETTTLGVYRLPKTLHEIPVIVLMEHATAPGVIRFMHTNGAHEPKDGGKVNLVSVIEFQQAD